MLEKLWGSQFSLTLLMNIEIIIKYILYKKCKFWPLLYKGRLKCIKMQEKALHFSKFSPGEKPPDPILERSSTVKKKISWAPPERNPGHATILNAGFPKI